MKAERNITTGSAAPSKKRAMYWKRLQFLDTVDDERETFSNANVEPLDENEIQNDNVDDPPENDIDDIYTQPTTVQRSETKQNEVVQPVEVSGNKKQDKRFRKDKDIVSLLKVHEEERKETRRRLDELMRQEPADDIDLFFQTMAATVKKFNPKLKTQAKMKVFNVITELEMQSQTLSDGAQCMSTFNYDTSLSLSTSANSPFSNDSSSIVDPVDQFLNCMLPKEKNYN